MNRQHPARSDSCPGNSERKSHNKLSLETGSQRLREFVDGQLGVLTTRLGATETSLLLQRRSFRNRFHAKVNAGVYPPTLRQIRSFARAYAQGIAASDIIGVWGDQHLQDEARLHEALCPSALRVPLTSLDPVTLAARGIRPWSDALADKVVGVVSPHHQEIQSQYSRRVSLFASEFNLLPAFTLKVTGTPLTHGLNLSIRGWSDHLRRMIESAKMSFSGADVVLVSAGSYGVPLTYALSQMGIPAIYMGGCLQLLFGIGGARWASDPYISGIQTKAWIHGARASAPIGRKLIEGGAYW